jgi:hypothetical protein
METKTMAETGLVHRRDPRERIPYGGMGNKRAIGGEVTPDLLAILLHDVQNVVIGTAATSIPEEKYGRYMKMFPDKKFHHHEKHHTGRLPTTLRRAHGIFWVGGDQLYIHLNTNNHDKQALQNFADEGKVVVGTSAGAAFMGRYMFRPHLRKDPPHVQKYLNKLVATGKAVDIGEHGLLIPGSDLLPGIVDTHLDEERMVRLIAGVQKTGELGIGLSENTALTMSMTGEIQVFGTGVVQMVIPHLYGVDVQTLLPGTRSHVNRFSSQLPRTA